MRFHLIGLALSLLISYSIKSQSLELKDRNYKIENRIELIISDKDYQKIRKSIGRKFILKEPVALFNGDSAKVDDIHTRGKTTLYLRRKSYSVNLDEKVTFSHSQHSESMKKFNAISLSMDKNYLRNRLAFELMEKIELFELYYTYCELQINGQTEGIYLIIERPQDWALKSKDSPLVIRRGFDHQIDKIKTGKKAEKEASKKYKNNYSSIYNLLDRHQGQELYDGISELMDLEMYMKWLAFNFFVHNGDYTDEVYFYIDTDENRFKIIPWDYDDIFAIEPHEGRHQKQYMLGDKYIFSSEDQLDQKIATDPILYEKYLEQLKMVLQTLDPDCLKKACENTFAELYPYFVHEDIMEISRYDTFKGANIPSLIEDLEKIYNQLVMSRILYLEQIEKQ